MEDSPQVAELNVEWREAEETIRDLFAWFVTAGKLPPSAVPGLGEPEEQVRVTPSVEDPIE